jgi:hypothetical protein
VGLRSSWASAQQESLSLRHAFKQAPRAVVGFSDVLGSGDQTVIQLHSSGSVHHLKHELVLVAVQTAGLVQEPTHSLQLHVCFLRLHELAPWTSPVPSSTAASTITQRTLPKITESTALDDDMAPPSNRERAMARNTSAEVSRPRTWDSALETRSGYLASDIRSDRRLVKRYFVRLVGAGRFELPTTCAGSVWRRGTECREQDSPPRMSERDEFDLCEKGTSVWRIRAEHRKGQRGKKRGLVIPLPPLAVRLLVTLREETGRGSRVFPVVGERFLANLFRSTEDVRQATGVRFTLHDLRATCATGVRRMSGLPHVAALVLGHQGVPGVPDVTSRYDRADTVPEVAKGLNAWAAHIESLVKQEPALRVVSIESTRKRIRG